MFNILIRRRRFMTAKKRNFSRPPPTNKTSFGDLDSRRKEGECGKANKSIPTARAEEPEWRLEHKLCFWLVCAPLDFVYTSHGRL